MNDSDRKGIISSIQLCPGYRKPMVLVDEAEVVENLGLKGDKHAIADSSRQILLIEHETLDALGLQPGQVKENITTKGIKLMKLSYKQRVLLGNDVIIEATKPCSPCSRMEELRPGLLKEIGGRRGMLFRVMKSGKIRQGDQVRLLEEQL